MPSLPRFRTPRLRSARVRSAVVAVVAVAALALTGCAASSGGSGSGSDTGATGSGLSLDAVKKAGKLVVATEGTYRPFTFHADGGSGKLTGYDVDVITAVAKKLGVTPEFKETQFDAIFAGLDAKRFDLIANQISVNPDRQKKYDFSEPYTVSPGVLIVKDGSPITDFADLKGKSSAQSLTSNWYQVAQDAGANVQQVEGWAQAVQLLKQGRVDATINDKLTFLDAKKTGDTDGLKVAAETKDVSKSAFTLRKGSDSLVTAIDKALDELRADGTLAKISDKYFGEDVSK
jgi:L-cystine transport system substrate-binding protein